MANFFKKNEKYATIAAYAVLSCLAIILVTLCIVNFPSIRKFFSTYSSVFSPFLYALLLAFFCNPLMVFFEKKVLRFKEKNRFLYRCRRGFAIALTLLTVALVLAVLFMMIIPAVASSYNEFSGQIYSYIESVQKWLDNFVRDSFLFGGEYDGLNDFLVAHDISTDVQSLFAKFSSLLSYIATWIINYAGKFMIQLKNMLLGLFIMIYFLAAKEKLCAQFKKILYSFTSRRAYLNLVNMARYTNKAFSGFIVGKILDSLIIGLLSFIVLGIFKMPYYPLISVMVGITNIIPVFGPFIGAIPSAFIILIADPPKAIWFILIIIVIQQLDGNVIGPKILGNATGLSALWVLLAIVVFGGFFGLAGMLFGVPLTAVLYAIASELVRRRLRRKGRPAATVYYVKDPPETDFENHTIFYDKDEVPEEPPAASQAEETPLPGSEPKLKEIVHTEIRELFDRRTTQKGRGRKASEKKKKSGTKNDKMPPAAPETKSAPEENQPEEKK